MNNRRQDRRWIPGIRGRAAGAALALAIMLGLAAAAAPPAQAQTYSGTVLHTFTGPPDGATPLTGLVQDAKGNLYGTTIYGGDSACYAPYGCGTLFKVDATGKETVLHSFTGTGGDGAIPFTFLVLDAKGNLYGTTNLGGDVACNAPEGCGTVFKFDTTTGKETVLYSFTGSPDAAKPENGLLLDAKGNLYGTTPYGGADGNGAVYEVDTTGKETVLYSFAVEWNHAAVEAVDAQGNLYGHTRDGGTYGNGTVFMLAPPVPPSVTWTETVLYNFTGGTDGSEPGELLRDVQGNLYGTTNQGGDLACNAPSGCGTVYELDTTLKESVLYSFMGGADGYDPGGLARDSKGNLYGGTNYGGGLSCNPPNGCGTVFKLDTTDKETVLYSFTGGVDGYGNVNLMRDAQGNMYGTAIEGGDLSCTTGPGGNGQVLVGCGTVFQLTTAAATTTTLTSVPNPSTYGQAVTFTAVVASKSGTPPNGETVTFMSGKTPLGMGTLSGGAAKFTTSTLKAGTTSVTAVYAGDASFAASTSKAVKQVVGKATTTTAVVSSANPSSVGQSVTFTATVTPEFGGTVTGKVAFYDGTTLLKSVAVSGGAAKFTTTKLTFRQAYDHGDIQRQHEFHRQFGDGDADGELGAVELPQSEFR